MKKKTFQEITILSDIENLKHQKSILEEKIKLKELELEEVTPVRTYIKKIKQGERIMLEIILLMIGIILIPCIITAIILKVIIYNQEKNYQKRGKNDKRTRNRNNGIRR